jgi:hypothetical protein
MANTPVKFLSQEDPVADNGQTSAGILSPADYLQLLDAVRNNALVLQEQIVALEQEAQARALGDAAVGGTAATDTELAQEVQDRIAGDNAEAQVRASAIAQAVADLIDNAPAASDTLGKLSSKLAEVEQALNDIADSSDVDLDTLSETAAAIRQLMGSINGLTVDSVSGLSQRLEHIELGRAYLNLSSFAGYVTAGNGDCTQTLATATAEAQASGAHLYIPAPIDITSLELHQQNGGLEVFGSKTAELNCTPANGVPGVLVEGSSTSDFLRPINIKSIKIHNKTPGAIVIQHKGCRHCGLFDSMVHGEGDSSFGWLITDGDAGSAYNRSSRVMINQVKRPDGSGHALCFSGKSDRGEASLPFANRDILQAVRVQSCDNGVWLKNARTHRIEVDLQGVSGNGYILDDAADCQVSSQNEGPLPIVFTGGPTNGLIYTGSRLDMSALTDTQWRYRNIYNFLDGSTYTASLIASESELSLFNTNGGVNRVVNTSNGGCQRYALNEATQFTLPTLDPSDRDLSFTLKIWIKSLGRGHAPDFDTNNTITWIGTVPDWATLPNGKFVKIDLETHDRGQSWFLSATY